MVGPTVLMVRKGNGKPARWASSANKILLDVERPWPPYSLGQLIPIHPSRPELLERAAEQRAAAFADGHLALELRRHELGEVAAQLLLQLPLLVGEIDVHCARSLQAKRAAPM